MIIFFVWQYFLSLVVSNNVNSPCYAHHKRYQNDIAIREHAGRYKRGATFNEDSLWPAGVIPYSISTKYKRSVFKNIKAAIKIWETSTCLTFITLTNETYGLKFEPQECGCCSFVGRQQFANNKPQEISISGEDCEDVGHMLHEIGHAIGFWHEHVRPDRDSYVRLNEQNIDPMSSHNFDKKNLSVINSLGEKYDYDSIMHYSLRSFSINKEKKTIIPTNKYKSIGQREQLSVGDMRQANKLYNCIPDENQCLINNGECQQICINLYRGHKCSCRNGFILDLDGRSCSLPYTQRYEMSEGMIYSPNYPNSYMPDISCMWELHAPTGYFIKLRLLKFDMEGSNSCKFDVLNIRSLFNLNHWKDIAILCGSIFPRTMTIKSNTVRLVFRSDNSVQRNGFKIFYKFSRSVCSLRPNWCRQVHPVKQQFFYPNLIGEMCDREYFSSSGTLVLPNSRPLMCTVKIQAKSRKTISIHINDIKLNKSIKCEDESMTIRKGNDLKLVSQLCGRMKHQIIKTNSRLIWIQFTVKNPMSLLNISYSSN